MMWQCSKWGCRFRASCVDWPPLLLPDVAIELKVTAAHLLNFSSVEEIALAKRELVEGLRGTESVAILNADDPRVAAMAAVAPGRVIFYGIEKTAEFSAEEIEDRGALGSSFTLVHTGKRPGSSCRCQEDTWY